MDEPRLNFAGRLAKTFIVSKLTIVFILGIATLGVVVVMLTPREENPQILVPGAQISVTLPGATPSEVEDLVITPLESVLSEIRGVDHIWAVAQSALGVVQVQFKVGEPKEESLVKLYDRVMSNLGRLPPDAGTPQIVSVDVDDVPIVTITLTSPEYDDYGLKRLADRLAERLHSIEDVSVVSVYGGHDREISVELDPERLQAFDVSLDQVSAAFSSSNLSIPLNETVKKGSVEAVKVQGFFASAEDVRNQIVGVHNGRPIYVGDIAVVKDGPPPEIERLSRFAFGPADARFRDQGRTEMPAVTIAVAKKKGTNATFVARDVLDRIERMTQNFVPKDVHVEITRNDGQKADDAVNLLIEHLGISVLSVCVVLIVFLGWKEALIVTLVVPLTLFVTLGADLFAAVTLNRVTLFALILSLGLLVDAAIVVIENIHRHYRHAGKRDKQAITVAATNEIGNATNLATFAVMVVFIALLLSLTGMPRQYFFPVAVTVPVAMAVSVIVAYVVAPWAANRWLACSADRGDGAEAEGKRHGLLYRGYSRLFRPLQEHASVRRLGMGFILILMVGSLLQGAWQFIRPSGVGGPQSLFGVNLGFLPKDNKNTFNIIILMPETFPVEETDRLARDIGQLLADNRYVLNYQTWLGQAGIPDFNALQHGTAGQQGSHLAEIRVNLIDKHRRSASSIEIVRDLRSQVYDIRDRYPGSKVRLVEDPPGPPMRATVLAEIYGPDPQGLRTLSTQVFQAFATTYDMVDLSDTEPVDVREHRIVPDKEKLALSKVSVAQIIQVLKLIYGGDVVSRAHPDDEKNPVEIRAFVPRRHEVDPVRLDRIFVKNTDGQSVPLSELVRVGSAETDRPIRHKDNERVTFVGGELGSAVPFYAVLDLDRRLDGMKAPNGRPLGTRNLTFIPQDPDVIDGYQLLWDGEMRLMLDTYRDMIVALGAALATVFLLLVAYYRSFLLSMIAMSAVPLGLIGIFPGHWLMGMDFSATSIVGIVALSGVAIRNSLLIIDFIQDNRAQGMSLEDAVREGGAVRLRPILLTTFAIVLGSAIMVTDPVFGGLAISLIFGTIASTMLTIFVVPILYYLDARRREKRDGFPA
jgi:multidrug efflux pump subunit AcrB